MNKPLRILVIQTAFLGDVILALPIIQTIKNHLQKADIDFLCIPETAQVIEKHPLISNVITYDKKGKGKIVKFFRMLSRIRAENYDVILTPHRFLRSALLTYYSGAKVRIGFNKNALSFLLTHKVAYLKDTHEVNRNISLVKAVPGIDFEESKLSHKPELFPSVIDEKIVNEQLKEVDESKLIAFAPCSKWITKQFPLQKSVELVKMLIKEGFNVALLGGEGDREFCMRLESRLIISNFLNLCRKLTPLQSYLVMKRSKLLITVDSAAQHLGAAAGVPIVLIYGSTNSSFGFYPLQSEHRIMEINELPCRPCTDHGRNKCPLGHFKCMEDIQTENILEMVINLTAKKRVINE